tara:strand:- start:59 stop:565 length:507 start_codon:yes stop_codon:yes gene_type:complete
MSARSFSFIKPKIKVGSLAERRADFEKLVKASDRGMATGQASSGVVLSPEAKAEIKKNVAKTLKATSRIRDDIDEIKGTKTEYKAKGGRVGLKLGTGRKSSLQKIQEAFGPKQVKKKEKPKPRMMAKKGSKPKKKFPDLNKDGKVTFADVLKGRGVINGKKKQKKKII